MPFNVSAGPLSSSSACPLCEAECPRRRIASVAYRDVWEALATQWEVRVPEEVARRLTPAPESSLLACGACGLHYFSPALPGDGDYYAALAASPRYYSPTKWEFDRVSDQLAPGDAVLDVGCGAGDFLAAVAPHVRRAVGVETSATAVAAARGRGLDVELGSPEVFARRREGEFDAVCLFHVAEHLPDVLPLLRAAVRCLRPRGTLYVSVPNRRRICRGALESLDCPPHHLSRWAPRQFAWLAGALGMRLVRLACEPADPAMLRDWLPRRLAARLEKIPWAGAALGWLSTRILDRTVFHRRLLPAYRKTRFFDRLGFRGMSMLAAYVRAPARGGGR